MDKNTITGLVIIAAIIIGFSIFNKPSQEEADAIAAHRDSIELARAEEIKATAAADSALRIQDSIRVAELQAQAIADSLVIDSIKQADPGAADSIAQVMALREQIKAEEANKANKGKYGPFFASVSNENKYWTVENDRFILTMSSEGGRIAKVEVKDYRTYDSLPVYLWEEGSSGYGVKLYHEGKELSTDAFQFKGDYEDIKITGDETAEFTLRLTADSEDSYIDYIYKITGNSHDVEFDVKAVGLGSMLNNQTKSLDFEWDATSTIKEKSVTEERRHSTIMWKPKDDTRDYLWEASSNDDVTEAETEWVAFKQFFFSAILTHEQGFLPGSKLATVIPANDQSDTITKFSVDMRMPVVDPANVHQNMSFYFGPNDYDILRAKDNDYEDIIDLGWGIFGTVNKWFVRPIFKFLEGIGLGYGLIILVLTIIIKIVLLPLMYKNYKSSAKMRVLKPEIEELAKKYPDKKDAMKKQQAQMELYRKTGVNPMAGCIPMLIQMPILYAMFRFFPSTLELRQESFLWADDLVGYDSIVDFGFNIPLYGDHISLFTILMAASTFFYTRMNSSQMQMPQQQGMPNMKVIMNFFPLMMLVFFNNFAAALSYYYFIANLSSIGQMVLIKKYFINEDKLRAKIEENKKKPKKKSKFQQRLADMQAQQQAQRGKKGK